jgi:hypothetical protein
MKNKKPKKNKNLKQVTITGIGPKKASQLPAGGYFRYIYCKEYGPGSWYDQMKNASAWHPFIQEIQSYDALLCHAKIKYDPKKGKEIINCDYVPDIISRFGKIKPKQSQPQPSLQEQIDQDETTLKDLVDQGHVQKPDYWDDLSCKSGLKQPQIAYVDSYEDFIITNRTFQQERPDLLRHNDSKNEWYHIYGPADSGEYKLGPAVWVVIPWPNLAKKTSELQ